MSEDLQQNILDVLVIGAGPAGLTAAYVLSKNSKTVSVLESDPKYVGGISKTVEFDGFRCDIGGHRFFSKSQEVESFWDEVFPQGMLIRDRSSRIYYNSNFFSYPLKGSEALFKLGIFNSIIAVLSYFNAKLFPKKNPKSFEDWVSNQFGKRLYKIFFKSYTEKVWGIPCNQISADWAAQRIKGLSLGEAIRNAFRSTEKNKKRDEVVKTLIDQFRYPKHGPGELWESVASKVIHNGSQVLMGRKVISLQFYEEKNLWQIKALNKNASTEVFWAKQIINTSSLQSLVKMLPENVLDEKVKLASRSLRYRNFITVALVLKEDNLFHDQWIYIHDPDFKVGRIQNFKSWSPHMVPDSNFNCYGLEYFCHEDDQFWSESDEALIALAKKELVGLGLSREESILKGVVIRQPKAYPVYDDSYKAHVNCIKENLLNQLPSLHTVGRNGMHMYNNQDHSMMTAMLVSKNILASKQLYDPWKVNQDAEYHEELRIEAERKVPRELR